jgi:hypothetical protein
MNRTLALKMKRIEQAYYEQRCSMPICRFRHEIKRVSGINDNGKRVYGVSINGNYVWDITPREYWKYLRR